MYSYYVVLNPSEMAEDKVRVTVFLLNSNNFYKIVIFTRIDSAAKHIFENVFLEIVSIA
jgi:hypothetical protein